MDNELPRLVRPEDILTDEVQQNLRFVFRAARLAIKGVYVKSSDSPWRLFPFSSATGEVDSAFCEHVYATEPFAAICRQERSDFCDYVMRTPREPVFRLCPFGLVTLGIGFDVGQTQVVLRGESWVERGTEGQAISATVRTLDRSGQRERRGEILPLLQHQQTHTTAQVRNHGEVLKGLLGLVRLEALAEYQHRVARSKEALIQKLSSLVYPVMALSAEDERIRSLREALEYTRLFLHVEACIFLFGSQRSPEGIVNLGTSPDRPEFAELRHVHRILFGAKLPSVGLAEPLSAAELTASGVHGARGCRIVYPEGNVAVFLTIGDPSGDQILDDHVLSQVVRTLSMPVSLASLEVGLEHEVALRRLQARNTLHTMRSTFQAVVGDVDYIRQTVTDALSSPSSEVEDSLAHMEELVGFMSALLRTQDYIIELSSQDSRPIKLKEKKPTYIAPIIERAKDSFRTRSTYFDLSIVIDKTITDLPVVMVDENAISLVFVHLFHNALKYSHHGAGRRRSIGVTSRGDSGFIYIDISDFGVGIHPHETEKIFQPLVQGSVEDTSRPITGQGLGLAAARSIARLHGGDVRLKTCRAYDTNGPEIPRRSISAHKPGSDEASRLLQHCLVVFEVSIPR